MPTSFHTGMLPMNAHLTVFFPSNPAGAGLQGSRKLPWEGIGSLWPRTGGSRVIRQGMTMVLTNWPLRSGGRPPLGLLTKMLS